MQIFFRRKEMKGIRGLLFLLVFALAVNSLFAGGSSAGSSGGSGGPTTISISTDGGGRTWRPDLPNNQEIMKKSNTILDVVIRQGTNALNLLFASNDLPDIVQFGGMEWQQYISTGYLRPLDDMLKTNGQNILKYTDPEAWKIVNWQGKTYVIPREGFHNVTFAYARSDWLKNVGVDLSRNQDFGSFGGKVITLNEYRDILTKFTRNDPDKNGRNDTYGLGATNRKTNTGWGNIHGAYGGIPGYYFIENNRAIPYVVTDMYREGLLYINSLWREGVIDPEIYLHTRDQARQKMINSVSGSGVGEGWSEAYMLQVDGLQALVPEADFIPLRLTSNDGRIMGAGDPGNLANYTSITTMSKNPEKAMDFLNWLRTDEGWHLHRVGVEGQDFNMVNGFPIMTDSGNAIYNNMILDTLWPLNNRLDLNKNLSRRPTNAWDQLLRQKWEFLYQDNPPPAYINSFLGIPNPTAFNEFGVDVNNWIEQSAMAFITGETPINDANWNNYINTWKRMGGVKILQGFVDNYNSARGTRITAGITE
jgi:putative aldouronate transport system substrate-binding protein